MAHLSGSGQRELYYVYDLNGNNARETMKLADNDTILSQSITTDFGQVVAQAQPNANGGFIYSRSEYNALGQLTKQYQDTGWNTAKTAATLYEYDEFGNLVKQTLVLASSPTPQNSPVTEMAYGAEALTDGIYRTVTRTRYNAAGNPLVSVQKSLVSNLSDTLESKNLTIDERNLTSTQWVEYHSGTKRKTYNALPTSDITAEAVTVDGFTLSQTDNAGVNCLLAKKLSKDRQTLQFVGRDGEVLEYNNHGSLLLNIIACEKGKKLRRLCPLILQKGFRVDVSEKEGIEIPLLEACDCGRWDTALHMLQQEAINPLVIKEALYTSLAVFEECVDCHRVILSLIQRLGTVNPATAPEFLRHAMIGRAWMYCLSSLVAGFDMTMKDDNRIHTVIYDAEPIDEALSYMQELLERRKMILFDCIKIKNGISADMFKGYRLKITGRRKYKKRSIISQIRYIYRMLYCSEMQIKSCQ